MYDRKAKEAIKWLLTNTCADRMDNIQETLHITSLHVRTFGWFMYATIHLHGFISVYTKVMLVCIYGKVNVLEIVSFHGQINQYAFSHVVTSVGLMIKN